MQRQQVTPRSSVAIVERVDVFEYIVEDGGAVQFGHVYGMNQLDVFFQIVDDGAFGINAGVDGFRSASDDFDRFFSEERAIGPVFFFEFPIHDAVVDAPYIGGCTGVFVRFVAELQVKPRKFPEPLEVVAPIAPVLVDAFQDVVDLLAGAMDAFDFVGADNLVHHKAANERAACDGRESSQRIGDAPFFPEDMFGEDDQLVRNSEEKLVAACDDTCSKGRFRIESFLVGFFEGGIPVRACFVVDFR